MASQPRVLGKGRVLGIPKPPPTPDSPAPAATNPDHLRLPDLVSPSASSLSLNSQQSTSKSSNDDTHISSAVALQAKHSLPATSTSSRMICPICNEEMMTLLQLNRHLDDAHKNLEDTEQDEVKTWFKTQMVKAKKFQPLAALNQKIKGLEVFESNEERRTSSAPRPDSRSAHASPEPSAPRPVEPEELVTREHWQRYTRDDSCSDPMCGRRLGAANGNVNCRKCGKLFCDEHTLYQMKLSRSAQHEPVRGCWCRVCETCFKSRPGYSDHNGVTQDHMDLFSKTRQKAVDKSYLEISRLEKRLTKLTQILTDPRLQEDTGTVAYLWTLSGSKSQRRIQEESVVDWEDDQSLTQCPYCLQEFTNYTFRRHHCRLCGRIVCADPLTGCSSQVGIDVHPTKVTTEKPEDQLSVNIRMCKDCKATIFGKSDFARELAQVRPDQRAYNNLKQFERGIRLMTPRFQKLVTALQDPENPPTPVQLAEATKVRKRLTDAFTQYNIAALRIRDLPTGLATQGKLQKQVYVQASQFLHMHMLPLKSLPKVLKHASPHGRSTSTSSINTLNGHLSPAPTPGGRKPLAAIQNRPSPNGDNSSQHSSESRLSLLETEEKAAREQLIVLEEQKFMVGEMLADVQRRRKFEEAESLSRNVEDLTRECDRLQSILSGLKHEVEGVWTAG